jgi:polyphosphate kinase
MKNNDRDADYEKELRILQIGLTKLQKRLIEKQHKVLVIFEGRDASGKDGTIKRIVEHLSPRETRVVALGRPSDRDRTSWYFQRWVRHLPAGGELVLFNRSWYNRAGVERVMGFCDEAEYEEFILAVPIFEQLLLKSGVHILKYYLDISKREQRERLAQRRADPLSQWKISPIDDSALNHWKGYSKARDEMLERTNTALAPWTVVRADHKKPARLNVIKDILRRAEPGSGRRSHLAPDPDIVFPFTEDAIEKGHIAK